jgi:hypothetical protein
MDLAIKELKEFPNDDMCLYRYIARALDTHTPMVSENGYIILENNPLTYVNQLNENTAVSQKPLTRLCIFYTMILNLSVLYIGWKAETSVPDEIEIKNKLMERLPIIDRELKKLVPHFTNKYAHIFDTCKRKCWIKDPYDDTNIMPIKEGEIPKDCGIDLNEWYKSK